MLIKVYVKLISFNLDYLNFFIKVFKNLCSLHYFIFQGPIYLPIKRKKFIFLRSVHINKKYGTGFGLSKFSRLFIYTSYDILSFYAIYFFLIFLKYRIPLGICIKFSFNYSDLLKS